METEQLNAFLGKVRKSRFIDYLDPIGETAIVAFERRLRWANRSKGDMLVGEEARFLLDNEKFLRRIIQEEIRHDEEQSWSSISEAPARGDWSNSGEDEPVVMVPTTGLTQEMDEDEAPPVPAAFRKTPMPAAERGRIPAPVVPTKGSRAPTPAPVPRKTAPPPEDEESDLQRTGIIRMEDLTPFPSQRVSALDAPEPSIATVPMAMPRLMTPLGTATPEPAPAVLVEENPAEDANTEPSAPPRTQAAPAVPAPSTNSVPWIGLGVGAVALLLVGVVVWRASQPTDLPVDPPPSAPVAEAPPHTPPLTPPIQPPTESPAIVEPPPEVVPPEVLPETPPVVVEKPLVPPVVPGPVVPPAITDTAEPPVVEVEKEEPIAPPVQPTPPKAPGPPTAAGLWVGKIGSDPIYLDIRAGTGKQITASANVREGDAYVQLDLRGTFDPETGALVLLDPYNRGRYNATLRDGTLSGKAAPKGETEISWSAKRK